MSTETALALPSGFQKASSSLALTLGIEPRMMIDTIKRQCFPGQRPEDISDTQLAAFISVANSSRLNPLQPGMLFAYPSRNGGIVPMTGPDGVFKMLDEHITEGKLDGYECVVFPEDPTKEPTHATAKIWRKGSERPASFTALVSEWKVGNNPNWGSKPRHMIWLRAIKQCARQVIHGVPYDEEEAKVAGMINVTGTAEGAPAAEPEKRRPGRPKRTGLAVVEAETVTDERGATVITYGKEEQAAAAQVVAAAEEVPMDFPKKAESTPTAEEISAANAAAMAEREKKVEAAKPVQPPPPAPESAKPIEQPKPVAGAPITVRAKVLDFKCMFQTVGTEQIPIINANVTGAQFQGRVIHRHGCKVVGKNEDGSTKWEASPDWDAAIEAPDVEFVLKPTPAKSGATLYLVQSMTLPVPEE